MKAEGILMHRSKNIIALRATQGTKTVIQVSPKIISFIQFILVGLQS